MNELTEKSMLSISEAAKQLGVSIQTLRRWAESGKLTPSFVSPGGHRYYAKDLLREFMRDLFAMARTWASASAPTPPPAELYCQSSSTFQARLSSCEAVLRTVSDLNRNARYSLVTAIVGEIGDNAFAHNLGNWPDMPGVFFAYDANRRQVAIADRGVGVLATLRRVRPSLKDDRDALQVAFTERISGRTPENRGNGLKFVRQVIAQNDFQLSFQSGKAILTLKGGSPDIRLASAKIPIRGTLELLTF